MKLKWTFWLNTSDERKARKLVDKVAAKLNLPLTDLEFSQRSGYHNEMRVVANSPLSQGTRAAMVDSILGMIQPLAVRWTVVGPWGWEFSGVAEQTTVSGVLSASFEVACDDLQVDGDAVV